MRWSSRRTASTVAFRPQDSAVTAGTSRWATCGALGCPARTSGMTNTTPTTNAIARAVQAIRPPQWTARNTHVVTNRRNLVAETEPANALRVVSRRSSWMRW